MSGSTKGIFFHYLKIMQVIAQMPTIVMRSYRHQLCDIGIVERRFTRWTARRIKIATIAAVKFPLLLSLSVDWNGITNLADGKNWAAGNLRSIDSFFFGCW